jgi:hypothetical protein
MTSKDDKLDQKGGRKMSVKRVLVIVMVSALLLAVGIGPGVANPARALPESSAEAARGTIPYAGRLTDKAGQPVPDGAYDLSFTLYGTVSESQSLWSEMQRGVVVSKGEFLTRLGSVAPIPATALSGQSLWLAVSVRGPGEARFTALTPRQRVSAAAPTASAGVAAAACPHDHLGESWIGDSGAQIDGLYVRNTKDGGTGLAGIGDSGDGVVGESSDASKSGVYGNNTSGSGFGVTGRSSNIGVYGTGGAVGVYGYSASSYAGYFNGPVNVIGYLTKTGGGFKIDHPLDPANQYLYHSFVESPDMKNIYDGVVTLDAKGEAVVKLPDWFGALNRDFRYQLTCIGGSAPVYIAEEIADNQFTIAGGNPGLKVSWQVTGIRQDPYAEQHRIPVEEEKSLEERGTYIYPEGYGLPATMGLDVLNQPIGETQP